MKADIDFEKRLETLRRKAEAHLSRSQSRQPAASDDQDRLVHDLQVHQIELELQNEELRETQRYLEQSRDRYLELYHNAPVGYVVTDSAGMILQANQTFSTMLEIDLAVLPRKPLANFLHTEDREIYLSRFKAFCKNPTAKRMEMRMLKMDGSLIYTALEGRRMDSSTDRASDDQSSVRLMITISDITNIKNTEQAIIRAKNQWEQTFDAVPDLVAIIDHDSEVVRVNKALAARVGQRPQACVGAKCYQLLHGDQANDDDCPHKAFLKTGRAGQIETYLPKLEGHFIVTVSPIRLDERQAPWCIMIAHDVTDRKKAEKELLKLRNLESLGTLAGGIAHDFNNILTAQVGNIELAKIKYDNRHKAEGYLDSALDASFRAKDLANWLLTFAEGGDPMSQPVILDRLIEEAARESLEDSGVTYDLQLSDSLEPLNMDAVQVKTALLSIIDNAREAMPRGGRLEIKCSRMDIPDNRDPLVKPGKFMKIEFSDQGIGIASTDLEKIFDPYFTTKPMGNRKGMGLGLSICHSIIKKHEGHIEVQSAEGRGTTVRVYLPLPERPVEPARQRRTAPVVVENQRPRLLVMEDEEIIWKVMRPMLNSINCDVEFVSNGHDALELYRQSLESGSPFEALILDLTIRGGMGAKEVIRNIHDIDRNAKAAVISGYSTDSIFIDYRRFGFFGALKKPFQADELKTLVLQMLADSWCPGSEVR